jgi:hypothetical protein
LQARLGKKKSVSKVEAKGRQVDVPIMESIGWKNPLKQMSKHESFKDVDFSRPCIIKRLGSGVEGDVLTKSFSAWEGAFKASYMDVGKHGRGISRRSPQMELAPQSLVERWLDEAVLGKQVVIGMRTKPRLPTHVEDIMYPQWYAATPYFETSVNERFLFGALRVSLAGSRKVVCAKYLDVKEYVCKQLHVAEASGDTGGQVTVASIQARKIWEHFMQFTRDCNP